MSVFAHVLLLLPLSLQARASLLSKKGDGMAKVMLFIDGTWLYANTARLGETFGTSEYHIDFGKIPRVLANAVGKQLGSTDLDIVRTYLFGSYATNYDLRDEDAVQRRREF